ncbi:MAG: hypothetical protein VKP63_08050 [Cyanobacteriota bacterium]|nr:hypothetical protein [Cyanobacteriota bacterium]
MKDMEKLHEAVVESDGRIRLNTPLHLERGLRILAAIPQIDLDTAVGEITLNEPALSVDWNKPEEDDAWAHL